MTQINYVIKQRATYLHIGEKEEDLFFSPIKKGCAIYGEEEANIVLDILENGGATHLIKVKVKDKNVYERPKKLMEDWRKKRIKKQHRKKE